MSLVKLNHRFAFLRTILVDGFCVLVVSEWVVQIIDLALLHVRVVEVRLGCWAVDSHLPENLPILRTSFSNKESSGLLGRMNERKVITSIYLIKLSDLLDIIELGAAV